MDGFLLETDSVILLLLPLDVPPDTVCELSTLSEEFLGLSGTGDLMASLRPCLPREALIARGMHFNCPEFDSSLSSTVSNCLEILQS